MKIQRKINLLVASISFINILSIILVLSYLTYLNDKKDLMMKMDFLSENLKINIENYLNIGFEDTRNLSHILQIKNSMNRGNTIEFLKRKLEVNPSYLRVYAGFEALAFDGADNYYNRKPGHDYSGRFIPNLVRKDNQIVLEPLKYYNEPGRGNYYITPKQFGKEVILEPSNESISNENKISTSFISPIIIDGKFIGIVGIEIKLDKIHELLKGASKTNESICIANSNGDVIFNNNVEGVVSNKIEKEVLDKLKESGVYEEISANYYTIYRTINPGNSKLKWYIAFSYPKSNLYTEFKSFFILGFIIGLIAIIIKMGVISFIFEKSIVKNLLHITEITTKASDGNLSENSNVTSKDEIGKLSMSINKMIENIKSIITAVKSLNESLFGTSSLLYQSSQNLNKISKNQFELSDKTSDTVDKIYIASETIDLSSRESLQNTEAILYGMSVFNESIQAVKKEMDQLSELSRVTNQSAQKGAGMIKFTSNAIDEIRLKSEEIRKFTKIIEEISKKTNLLALNAAIEAARAGESGRGFAVVAEEISKLASSSANSVKEINNLTGETVLSIQNGSKQVESLLEVLRIIIGNVKEMNNSSTVATEKITSQISHAEAIVSQVKYFSEVMIKIEKSTSEQKLSSNDLRDVASQMVRENKIMVDASNELTSHSDNLKRLVEEMNNFVNKFHA